MIKISELVDKNAIMQVFGCIMERPLLLAEIDKYHLERADFIDRFTRSIFVAINNIFQNGAQKVDIIDIDTYLDSNREIKEEFNRNHGIQYLQDCLDIHDLSNFAYYYGRVKKFSALRQLKRQGFDISDFYCEDVSDKDYEKIQNRFEELELKDIFDLVKKKLLTIENNYGTAASKDAIFAAEGLKELKESLKQAPDVGNPLQGVIFNTVTRGARKGKFYLRSSLSGNGKSRLALGDACNLAIPERFDSSQNCWVGRETSEKTLYITTELTEDEIQTMIISWVSDVNESIILEGAYTPEEERRVDKAIKVVEKYKDNLVLKQIADPSISAIEACVRQQVLVNNIENVFYDYIFSSPSLFNEFKGAGIREDVVLTLLSTALKDLAAELNIFIMSSTQLSGDVDQKKGIRDQRFLRNSKGIADKADIGVISMWITKEERDIIEHKCLERGLPIPNYVTDVYKVRRGRHKNVKIWSIVDLGTCKITDIFMTDGYYNAIDDYHPIAYEDEFRPIACGRKDFEF